MFGLLNRLLSLLYGGGRKQLRGDAVLTAGSNLFSQGTQMITGILVLKLVEPEDYGLWAGVMLLVSYSQAFHAGILNGMSRELPYAVGEGKPEEALLLQKSSFTFTFLAAGASVLLFGAAALLRIGPEDAYWRYGLLFGAVASFFSLLRLYGELCLQSYKLFRRMAAARLVFAGTSIIGLVLVWWLGFYGLASRIVVVMATSAIVSITLARGFFRPALQWQHLKRLLHVGVPIFVAGYLYTVLNLADRSAVGLFLGRKALAYYSVAVFIFTSLLVVPSSLAYVFYPRMIERLAKTKRIGSMEPLLLKTVQWSLTLLIPAVAAMMLAVPPFVEFVIPKYVEAIPAIRVMLLAALMMAASGAFCNALNAAGKSWHYVVLLGVAAAANWAATTLVLRAGGGLVAAAWCKVGAFAIVLVGSVGLIRYFIRSESSEGTPEGGRAAQEVAE